MNTPSVLKFLFPNAVNGIDYMVTDDGSGQVISTWGLASPQPTKEELITAGNSSEYQSWFNLAECYRKRELEYPTTKEMIVALWEHVIETRPQAALDLQAKRQAVKQKYPKPT